ncbi:MAG: hypothetical protein QXW80_06685 [Candidatus Micrarchaeia archaeon]
MHPQSRKEEIDNLKRMIGEQYLVINAFLKKKATRKVEMIVVEDLKEYMSLREILTVSGISPPLFYYRSHKKVLLSSFV